MARTNRTVVPESRAMLKQMQYEIASEFGLYGASYGGEWIRSLLLSWGQLAEQAHLEELHIWVI